LSGVQNLAHDLDDDDLRKTIDSDDDDDDYEGYDDDDDEGGGGGGGEEGADRARRETMDLSAELEGFGFSAMKRTGGAGGRGGSSEGGGSGGGKAARKSSASKLFSGVQMGGGADAEKGVGGDKKKMKKQQLQEQGALSCGDDDENEADAGDLYNTKRDHVPMVNENSLGGLRVIYSGFRDMNDTVKLEALAVMVNLSISNNVADSLVFHQEGDTLTHILEMIWAPGVFTKFACLVLANLATKEHRRVVILRRGGLAAVIGLLLGSNYELQVSACRCLVNFALSPERHVHLFSSDVFVERLLTKLASVEHPEVQMLVSNLIRRLSVRAEFARALNKPERRCVDRLKKLRDSEDGDVSKNIMEVTNTLMAFRTNEQRAAEFMGKHPSLFTPITAEVTWDTWSSKLERMWDPVLTIAPVAKV
jgi:hypothetical protein